MGVETRLLLVSELMEEPGENIDEDEVCPLCLYAPVSYTHLSVDRRNSGVRTGIEWLTVERVDTLYKTSVIRN